MEKENEKRKEFRKKERNLKKKNLNYIKDKKEKEKKKKFFKGKIVGGKVEINLEKEESEEEIFDADLLLDDIDEYDDDIIIPNEAGVSVDIIWGYENKNSVLSQSSSPFNSHLNSHFNSLSFDVSVQSFPFLNHFESEMLEISTFLFHIIYQKFSDSYYNLHGNVHSSIVFFFLFLDMHLII
jgi:hypothetical protein